MCDYGQGFFIGAPMTGKQVTETLAALPYVQDFGKTVISSLWERAEADTEDVTSPAGLSTNAIAQAMRQKQEDSKREPSLELAMAGQAEPAPLPGHSPMAPRMARAFPAPAAAVGAAKPRKQAKRDKPTPPASQKSRKPAAKKSKAKR